MSTSSGNKTLPEVGGRIPGNTVHAVSVSLPRVADVIGYEEKRSETMSRIKSGYPRFVAHPYVTELVTYFQPSFSENPCVVVSSRRAAQDLFAWAEYHVDSLIEEEGIVAFPLPEDESQASHILSYIQHTGCLVSSRRAEKFLLDRSRLSTEQSEERVSAGQGQSLVQNEMARLNELSPQDVFLSASGMNGIYGAFRTIQEIQKSRGRDLWIQLGWLYVDNILILEKFSSGSVKVYDLHNLDEIRRVIREYAGRIAGIVTEVPTNPLLQTPDLAELYGLCQAEGCALIADISVGSSVCIDAIPHCDIAVESLTKFASGSCDVMMGAVMINPESPFHGEILSSLDRFLELPYFADADRLAARIPGYRDRMVRIGENVRILGDRWDQHPAVRKLYRADQGPWAENYHKIARKSEAGILPGGMITMEVGSAMESVYDSLQILKGPSFGTDFTLVMLYMYLAHYDLVSTEEGRATLAELQMDPGLFRISIGMEDPDTIYDAFERAFQMGK
ncbi:MAG: Cys/Met metabolism PLP-dependent enzyme [Leptospiraceae bacterium]|nr:Cys/Met metabolism PLP-dependent enzyme [Leptospiraceae bacterium]